MYDREYEYIMAIAKTGTLSKAAVSLGVSQPALTRFLQKEEKELGTPLFQKTGSRMTLTYAGECYVEHVKEILAIQQEMISNIQDIARSEKGRIRVGVPSIRRPYTIFSVIPEFRRRYPSIDISLNENGSDMLEQMLEELELDVIAVNAVRKKENFTYQKVADEEFVLAVPATSPLLTLATDVPGCKYPALKPEQLKHENFIVLAQQHRIRQIMDKLLSTHKVEYKTSMLARSLESALEAVSVNLGITFTPEIPLRYVRNSQNIRYLSVDAPGMRYEFDLVFRKGSYITPILSEFSRIFRENYQLAFPWHKENAYISSHWTADDFPCEHISRKILNQTFYEKNGLAGQIDLYLPETGNGPFPLILNVSGGGWFFGRKSTVHLGKTVDVALANGFAVASMACTSSRLEKYPYQIWEIKAAIRFLRSHASEYHLDGERFVLWSPSSGGHLSLMTALTKGIEKFDAPMLGYPGIPADIQAIVATYPVTEIGVSGRQFQEEGIDPLYPTGGMESNEGIFLGKAPEDDPALCREASPLSYITEDAPPLYLQHGGQDQVVPFIQSQKFVEKYIKAIGPEKVCFHAIFDAGHSDKRFKSEEACQDICDFLKEVLDITEKL